MVSLGNPWPYHNTFHSAGHHALRSLQQHLLSSPAPQVDASRLILRQCTTLMNISGGWVRKAYERLLDETTARVAGSGPPPLPPGLVVLHDQIELPFAAVRRVDKWTRSARGHNGMRDVLLQMGPLERRAALTTTAGVKRGGRPNSNEAAPSLPWARIEIGIGPRDTAMRKGEPLVEYVLREMTAAQVEQLAVDTGPAMAGLIAELEARWWQAAVAEAGTGPGARTEASGQ